MKELRTEIEINAGTGKVWDILTGLNKYPEWNPFIYHVQGTARVGEKVDIQVRSGEKEMTLHCTVTAVEPGRKLSWKYHVGLPILFQGEHSFILEPLGEERVRFIDREVFNGLFVASQARNIDTSSRRGFEAMDLALKR
ncbi:MAG: SRPBCC family protein, partial [Syntrophothermus sp.]